MRHMPEFEFDPGLTVRTTVDELYPQDGLVRGKMVQVVGGTFQGLVGHVRDLEDAGDHMLVVIRQGTPEMWEGYNHD